MNVSAYVLLNVDIGEFLSQACFVAFKLHQNEPHIWLSWWGDGWSRTGHHCLWPENCCDFHTRSISLYFLWHPALSHRFPTHCNHDPRSSSVKSDSIPYDVIDQRPTLRYIGSTWESCLLYPDVGSCLDQVKSLVSPLINLMYSSHSQVISGSNKGTVWFEAEVSNFGQH